MKFHYFFSQFRLWNWSPCNFDLYSFIVKWQVSRICPLLGTTDWDKAIGEFLRSLSREMMVCVAHWFFIEIILFLGKLLHRLKSLSHLVLIWKNPTQYMESKLRMSLNIQIVVKALYVKVCHLSDWKVSNFEKNCVLIVIVISFLCYSCFLLIPSLFYGRL